MSKISIRASVLALAVATTSTPVWAQATSAAPKGEPGRTVQTDSVDIIVTASKRAEKLQDVPSAVTALTSEVIEARGIQRISDYVASVPGFAFRDNGAPGYGTVILRSLNTGANQQSNTTAFYFDETPMTANGSLSIGGLVAADPDISDVERIEVLKGPQGTLYGASSLGGLIRIVSRKPDSTKFFGSARLDSSVVDGGGFGYGARMSLNLPLVADKLALTASGLYRHMPGWVDNVATGRKDVNKGDSYGGRLSLLWDVTPDLKIQATGTYQDTETSGWNYTQAQTDTLTPIYGRYKYDFNYDRGIKSKYITAELNAEWDTGAGTLTATGSYADYDIRFYQESTRNYGALLGGAFGPIAASAYPHPTQQKYSADVRFASKRFGPVEFILGGFYTSESTAYDVNVDIVSLPSKTPLAKPFDVLAQLHEPGTYKEVSGYGNVTLFLNGDIDVTGGLRYSHNVQRYRIDAGSLFYSPSPLTIFPVIKENKMTYLATARWRISPRVSTYIRAASGYRPSSPNTTQGFGYPPIVESDEVWSYEIGAKGSTRDGTFSGEIAAYHIDWSRVQLTGLAPSGLNFLLNGGNAYVNGLEIQAQMRPTTGLSVSTNFAYNFSKFTRVDPAATASTGVSVGSRLPLTPNYAVTLDADYKTEVGSNELTFGATMKFVGENHSSFERNLGTNPDLKLPSYTTFDARAGIDFGRFNAILRVENITNTYGIATASTTKLVPGQPGVDTLLTPTRPRTFSITLGTQF